MIKVMSALENKRRPLQKTNEKLIRIYHDRKSVVERSGGNLGKTVGTRLAERAACMTRTDTW